MDQNSDDPAGMANAPILRLPPEIFSRILFFAAQSDQGALDWRERAVLRSVSMTCRAFRKPAQAILLRRVYVRNDRQCARIARWLVAPPKAATQHFVLSWRNSCGTQSPAVIRSVVFGRLAAAASRPDTFLKTDGVVALLKLLPHLHDLVFAKFAPSSDRTGEPDGLADIRLDELETFAFASPRSGPPAWLIDALGRFPRLRHVDYSMPCDCDRLGLPGVRSLRMVCVFTDSTVEPLAWPSLRVLAVPSNALVGFCARYTGTIKTVQALRLLQPNWSYSWSIPALTLVPDADCPRLDLIIDERLGTRDAIPFLAWSKARTYCIGARAIPILDRWLLPSTVERVVAFGAPAGFERQTWPTESGGSIAVEAVPYECLDEEALLDRGEVLPSRRQY